MGLLDPPWMDDPSKMLKPAPVEGQWQLPRQDFRQGPIPQYPAGQPPPAPMPEMRGLPQGPPPGQPESPLMQRMPMPRTAPMPEMEGNAGGEDPRQTILAMFKKYGLT